MFRRTSFNSEQNYYNSCHDENTRSNIKQWMTLSQWFPTLCTIAETWAGFPNNKHCHHIDLHYNRFSDLNRGMFGNYPPLFTTVFCSVADFCSEIKSKQTMFVVRTLGGFQVGPINNTLIDKSYKY